MVNEQTDTKQIAQEAKQIYCREKHKDGREQGRKKHI